MKLFFLKFFTWWSGQTFGTQLWTWRFGELVGKPGGERVIIGVSLALAGGWVPRSPVSLEDDCRDQVEHCRALPAALGGL